MLNFPTKTEYDVLNLTHDGDLKKATMYIQNSDWSDEQSRISSHSKDCVCLVPSVEDVLSS